MKTIQVQLLLASLALLFTGWKTGNDNWIVEKHKGYDLIYTPADSHNKNEYKKRVENGISGVKIFFNSFYSKPFKIFIHPNRHSLDSSWQADWKMPDFKSECWMVASGVATRLDMISPNVWDQQACEHSYADRVKTQQLITHELVHVYHGQLNSSPDFSNTEEIDWFVEGLATYVSGQCDSLRISEVKKAITDNKTPKVLNDFWKGKLKYALSGTVVMYIDKIYGRTKLKALLSPNKKSEILSVLNVTEEELLNGWKSYLQKI